MEKYTQKTQHLKIGIEVFYISIQKETYGDFYNVSSAIVSEIAINANGSYYYLNDDADEIPEKDVFTELETCLEVVKNKMIEDVKKQKNGGDSKQEETNSSHQKHTPF